MVNIKSIPTTTTTTTTTAKSTTPSSTAIWWIKNPTKAWTDRKRSMGAAFSHDFSTLFRNISLHGYNKMFLSELHVWERFIWFLVHVVTFILLIVVLTLTWEQFVAQYFVTILKDPFYPVENIAFPAVSICTNNRISRQAAIAYAKQLNARDPLNNTIEYYMEHLKLLTNQYPRYQIVVADDEYVDFQTLLDRYGTLDNETFYHMRRHMTELTPSCKDVILKCWIGGKEIECFNKNAFNTTLTMYGPCCTFNSEHNGRRERLVGPQLGLSVALNASKSDDHSNVLNIDGYAVLIHNPGDFAEVATGAAYQIFATHGVQSLLSIKPRVIAASEVIRQFSPRSRKCLFDDETPSGDVEYNRTYTYANCLTRCRIRSIVALCRCLPYIMPLELLVARDGVVYCTLSHVPCLVRYSFKWRSILTERKFIPGLEREMEDALYCPQCLPECDDVQYKISLLTLPLSADWWKARVDSRLNLPTAAQNISVLYVHYGEFRAQLFMRVLANSWVEAFSTVGNILAIFMGFSIVAIFEILFFLVKYLILLMKRFLQHDQNNEVAATTANEPMTLFICP